MGSISHGVEQELQIVGARGELLRGRRDSLSAEVAALLPSNVFAGHGPDAYSSQFEYWVGIMPDLSQLENFLRSFRAAAVKGAKAAGVRLLACGTNPITIRGNCVLRSLSSPRRTKSGCSIVTATKT